MVDRLAAQRNTARLPLAWISGCRTFGLFGADVDFYVQIFNAYPNEWFVQYDPNDTEQPLVVKMLPIVPTFGFDFRF